MSFESDSQNPYAAPSVGAEAGGKQAFGVGEDLRKLISTTATLMIVGGLLQMLPGISTLVVEGVSAASLANLALFGVVPAFTAIAGFSLRSLAKPGDDRGALLAGFRQLHVAFLVKGIVLITFIVMLVLILMFAFLGINPAFLGRLLG